MVVVIVTVIVMVIAQLGLDLYCAVLLLYQKLNNQWSFKESSSTCHLTKFLKSYVVKLDEECSVNLVACMCHFLQFPESRIVSW